MGRFLECDASFFTEDDPSLHPKSAATALVNSLCVGWIDRWQLTRECFANAAPAIQPMLTILPFTSINDYLAHPNVILDLVVYYAHDMGPDATNEILSVRKAIPNRSLLIISNLTEVDRATITNTFNDGMIAFLQPQRATLQFLVSALYMMHHERQISFDDILTIAPQHSANLDGRASITRYYLTQKEKSVLELVRQGQANKDIAQSLQMSTSTVKAHVRNIMQKMRASNRTQLALNAERQFRHGDIHPA